MKKVWFCLMACIMSAILATGCGSPDKAPATSGTAASELAIGLMPDTDSVPFIVAREKGFFEAEGVRVRLVPFKSAMDRDAALQSGNLDGAVSDLLAVAFLKAGGFDVAVTSRTDGSYRLVAGKTEPSKNVKDLAGREVAISRNTIIEYVTDQILAREQMAPDSFRKIAIPQIPARLEMLQNGKLAAATLPEPMASVAVYNGCHFITGSDELGINPGVMVFTRPTVTQRRKELQAMYRAYNRAVEYLQNTKREEYIGFIVEKAGFPEATREALKLPAYQVAALPSEKDAVETMTWLREKKLISQSYTYQDLVVGDCLP